MHTSLLSTAIYTHQWSQAALLDHIIFLPVFTMPAIVHQSPKAAVAQRPQMVARSAEDDEHYVMWRYASHATRCSQCEHPLETMRQKNTLCRRGILHARAVNRYFSSRNGKLYSLVDRDADRYVQVQVPSGCGVIRELMLAQERGFQIETPTKATATKAEVIVRNPDTELLPYADFDSFSPSAWDRKYAEHVFSARTASKKRPSEVNHYLPRGTLYHTDVSVSEMERRALAKERRTLSLPRRVTWES
jgi:hypothetical protein